MTVPTLPAQTSTPIDFLHLPRKDELVKAFVGQPLSSLRTPAIVLDRTRFARNCEAMSESCVRQGITFRAHVKTHKAIEGVRMQLTAGQGCSAIVCSTLMECWHVLREGLVQEGLVKDMLYGLPCGLDKIQDLQAIASEMHASGAVLRLMIDHVDQIKALAALPNPAGAWSIFIKVDGGGKRAGLPPSSEAMRDLVTLALSSKHISIHGFYSHFGQSYASTSTEDAAAYLRGEVDCVSTAAKVALEIGPAPLQPYTLSVGATPTAHAIDTFKSSGLPGILELHAGNYCCLDLQQYATKMTPLDHVATSVLSHVISSYPHRQEAMCDAGAIAMARDGGPLPGFGQVVWPERLTGWDLGRMSQEHGILTRRDADAPEVCLGETLRIVGQHACVTLAAHPWFYCVDDGGDVVTDVWVPWKGF